MTYDELKRRTQRGDREAAVELLPLAREAGEARAILTCWRMLHPPRFSAWQALDAALRAGERSGVPSRHGFDTTQEVRTDVIARALVEGSESRAAEDPLAAQLLGLARELLDAPPGAPWRTNPGTLARVRATLREVLCAGDDALALEHLAELAPLLAA